MENIGLVETDKTNKHNKRLLLHGGIGEIRTD